MKRHETCQNVGELSRRQFMQTAAAAAAASITLQSSSIRAAEVDRGSLIDTNVALGQWPFRHVQHESTPELVAKLRQQGVSQAWAGSLDALLHKDMSSVNARLADECKQHGKDFLIPIGAINLKLPDWEEDLRRCDELHRMPGVRLHPNYHGYKLSDPEFARLLELVGKRNMLVQISVIMEDERTLHPLVNVPPTSTAPLGDMLKQFPNTRLQLLNAFRTLKETATDPLASLGVGFEIAMLEGTGGMDKLLKQLPLSNLCFGSYSPVFYLESAKLKLQESELDRVQAKAICSDNALQLLNKA